MNPFSLLFKNQHQEFAIQLEKLDINLVNEFGQNLLMEAIVLSKDNFAKTVIENNIHLNHQDHKGLTALHYCVLYDNKPIAKMIIEKGADVNIKDENGNNALWGATIKNSALSELILNAGGNPNSLNIYNKSPLLQAIKTGNQDLINLCPK